MTVAAILLLRCGLSQSVLRRCGHVWTVQRFAAAAKSSGLSQTVQHCAAAAKSSGFGQTVLRLRVAVLPRPQLTKAAAKSKSNPPAIAGGLFAIQ